MTPNTFIEKLMQSDATVPGTQILKRTLRRFCSFESLSLSGKPHHDWMNHRDYNQYNPANHTILCCGWTDWHDHRDS